MLAATLGASYGIYGPAFELLRERAARAGQRGVPRLGEVRDPALGPRRAGQPARPDRARQPHPPRATRRCSSDARLRFHRRSTTTQLHLPTARRRADGDDVVLVVVNLDPHHTQSRLGRRCRSTRSGSSRDAAVPGARPARAARATSGTGARNYVELDPQVDPGARLPRRAAASAREQRLRLLPVRRARPSGDSAARTRSSTRSALVQGRGHLRAARPRLLRQRRRRHRRLPRA